MDFEQLTAAVIHDLKNQMQTLVTESERIRQAVPPSYTDSMDALLKRTRGIQSEISQLITLYQMKSHSIFTSDEAWPQSTLRMVTEQALVQYPGVQIHITEGDDSPGFYNDFLVQMALACMVTNSVQAGATEVRLQVKTEGGTLMFSVSDNGPGFPDNILAGERISRRIGGTGLGLYFSELVARHHHRGQQKGHVSLSNNPEGGAQVTLTLP
ncbi:MAG TPA: hypothetical protein DEA26_09390 [Oceanospirillales bacterium]|nr:hypothetical protein [Oceanospirillales bacterium]